MEYLYWWLVVAGLEISALTGEIHQSKLLGSFDKMSLLILKLISLKCRSLKFRFRV